MALVSVCECRKEVRKSTSVGFQSMYLCLHLFFFLMHILGVCVLCLLQRVFVCVCYKAALTSSDPPLVDTVAVVFRVGEAFNATGYGLC